jgi:hypothetical protein
MAKYIKHIYWLAEEEEVSLREELRAAGLRLKSAKGVVCTPLDEMNKISSVSPEVWTKTCARQGSWYRASPKSGLHLIISSFELDHSRYTKEATITKSDFRPPRYANEKEKMEMIRDRDFARKVPAEWQTVSEVEKGTYLRWAKRLGSSVEYFDFLYLSHTANHANFVAPRFVIGQEGGGLIPYSIDHSAHLCSCCLELFQILGQECPRKLVAPCPGATIFARLKPDEYLLVEK